MQFIDLKAQYNQNKSDIDSRIFNVLEHGKFILGPEVAELEARLADYVGVKHCIGLSNGTDALLLALKAVGVGANDEVITPAFSYFATAEVTHALGAKCVFVDVDENTYNLNPNLLEEKITEKTKAIIPVSLYGQPADLTRINEIANKHGIAVIEDGAQSFGATHHGAKSCGISTIGCTSFFPSKPLGCYGDGGACFTNDDALAELLKSFRAHGQQGRYNHVRIGVNARLDTIQAAILLTKLDVFPKEVQARAQVAKWYASHLPAITPAPFIQSGNTSVFGQYTVRVKERNAIQAFLKERGIPTAVHYPKPLYEQPALAPHYQVNDCPVSARLSNEVMSLPFHPYMEESAVAEVCDVLTEALETQTSVLTV